jgi:hypothetical protein
MLNTLKDKNILDHFTRNDKKIIEMTSNAALQYVSTANNASAAEFEARLADVKAKFDPILARAY